MTTRVEVFQVVVPAGTLSAAPVTIATRFDDGIVDRLEILVPPGPNGLMGFRVNHGGGAVFPRETSKWIVADGEKIDWPMEEVHTAGDWAIVAYNTGIHDHTLYVRFLVRESFGPSPITRPALAIEQPNQPAPTDELAPLPPTEVST